MSDCCNTTPKEPLDSSAVSPLGSAIFRIPNMDCASEEADIRRALESVPGIRSLNFQLVARTLAIDAQQEAIAAAVDAIGKAGFKMLPLAPAKGKQSATAGDEHGVSAGVARLVAALVFAGAAEALSFFAPDTLAWKLAGMGVALAAIYLAGLDVYKKGLTALFQRKLNINALMTVAVTGAFLIGQWPEAAMVMALYSIAELIEALAVDRARNAIKGLLALAPEEAETRQADDSWKPLGLQDVPLNAVVRVKPGGRVPLDGTVLTGNSAVNQAPVTGESIPVDKAPGDAVFAGTINEAGELEIRVTAAANDSTLARIIHAVEQAQGTRAPTQKFVDRFAAIYTPAVFVMALGIALLTPLMLDWTWMQALYKALVLLVIACPCALVISTPVTVVSGLAAAARRGILIKGGTYLEDARRLKAIALDKTGTVTEGKPALVDWQVWHLADKEFVRQIAASLSARSDHPVSKAIAAGLDGQTVSVDAFTALAGRGVQGTVDGKSYILGNHRLVEERKQCSSELEAVLAVHEEQGRTVTLLADDQAVLGIFAVADTIKESSRQAIAELQSLGVTTVMLTGDNAATAKSVAALAGIADARGNLLPEEKLAAIQQMQVQYGPTGMAGDGINDAPALAQADIGFAMGAAGTDIAMETADVVIMNDNLQRVGETIRLSRRTHAILLQNISFALGVKAVFFVLAVFGSASMWMAVFADMGASLLVVVNGLRLLRK
ncbi:MAG: heavy metal translocating P-type ATPase [Polaromonas sp.]|jgi:Cd2+/Zn2+-exporting ATPase|uniref:heavy metal translocating P-type ATPase n=1 Tax=Polaromonas sp. TaxID=1869339 RepID=UPI00248995C9|nr:heavy metal translocating P-type ATPase [Polaromonas sp.]MDI1268057.1 heavy metal translocating P-type ATPase [Polaromonas sp.]